MALSRRLGVIGILSASWLVAVGCGSDDAKHVNSAGDAGEAGESAGGTPSSGGSSNNAGKGGTSSAGKGGTAGSAGKGGNGGAGAGTAGTNMVGEAGQGGDGTSLAGAGGAPETPMGGAGGAAGAGGDGTLPAPQLQLCSNQCEVDDDCLIDGVIEQMICDQTAKRCVSPTMTACDAPADCAPWAGSWQICETSDQCDPDYQKCVTWQGVGYCAWLPDCLPGDALMNLPEHGKVDPQGFDVCVTPGACVAGSCSAACETTECGGGSGDVCNPDTHQCECTTGDECTTTHVCGADHHCTQCVIDDDCPAENSGLDKCVNGKCGCSGAAACPDLTANATPVCE